MRQQVAMAIRSAAVLLFVGVLPGCPDEAEVRGSSFDVVCGAGTVAQGSTCVAASDTGGTATSETDTGVGDVTEDAGGDDVGDSGTSGDGGGEDGASDSGAACVPDCAGKACGGNGCGGSCGTCGGGTPFCQDAQCVASCEPKCLGKVCGDNGCGGSCGSCEGGAACNPSGVCVDPKWTCPASAYQGDGVCDCGCGLPDPDCAVVGLAIKGCAAGQLCKAGACIAGAPAAWTCAAAAYADGSTCDCACGAVDPDCANKDLPVIGCDSFVCTPEGTCGACVPDCAGKTCGPNGCGGVCGLCANSAQGVCQLGKCVDKCAPQCQDKTCGGDGCGGVCGTCKDSETCVIGHCQALPPVLSCKSENACGKVTSGGCSCEPDCLPGISCCPDKVAVCGCSPVCGGKQCGDNGCGGTCGTCAANEACSDAGHCVADPCKPDPCGGKGACVAGFCSCVSGYGGAQCEVCAAGFTGFPNCKKDLCFAVNCSGHGACDPTTGTCKCDQDFQGIGCAQCVDAKKVFPACDKPVPPCTGKACGGYGVCDTVKDACVCAAGYTGASCDKCVDGGKTWPQCTSEDGKCGLSCSGKGKCAGENSCVCDPGFAGANCELCADANKTWPSCGNTTSGTLGLDPVLSNVTCPFCGVPLDKAPFTADGSDSTPPQLKVLIPPMDGLIAPGMPIIAVIDDVIDPKTVTTTTFRVFPESNAEAVIGGTIVRQVTVTNNTVLVFYPKNLTTGGKYKIAIDGVQDKGGNALAKVDSAFVLGSGAGGALTGNGSFEAKLSGCFFAGDVGANVGSDNISPTDGATLLAMSSANGPTVGGSSAGALGGQSSVVFCGPLQLPPGKTKVSFDYNFASAEFDEYVGDQFDDIAFAAVSNALGGTGGVVTSVNMVGKNGLLTKAYGLPGEGDDVAKMSGWKTATIDGVDAFGDAIYLTFAVADVADAAYTSVLTIDRITLSGKDPVCGDGVLEGAEECDDKNGDDGDGCAKTCTIEPGYACANTVDLNTGSDGKGGQAALGSVDVRWETAIGTNWGSEGAAGDLKAVAKTPALPPAGLLWQKAGVSGACVGAWAQPDPKKAAQWISTEGWDPATKACQNPKSCSVGQLYYYRTKFSIPNAKTAEAMSLQGTLWADNQITRVWINGKQVTQLPDPAPGASSFTGAGQAFAGWTGYFQPGDNEIVFAVANFTSPECPNPQGLLVAVDLAKGSVCTKTCGVFGQACCPAAGGGAGSCTAPLACDAGAGTCKCAGGGVACSGACCAAGEYCKAGKCENPATVDCLSIFQPGASVLNADCEQAGTCPATCKAILAANPSAASGRYLVRPDPAKPPFPALCDMLLDGGGWTLVGFEPAAAPTPANSTGIMANLSAESAALDLAALASVQKAGFVGPRFAYPARYQEARISWCTAAKAYRYQRFQTSAALFANTVANKPLTPGGGAGQMIPLSGFTSNDADLNKQLAHPDDAAFCRAYAGGLVPGDTSWGVKQRNETSNVCGCNSKGWAGTGAYYGGKGGGGNNDGCTAQGGGWAGTAGNGVKKGGINANTTFLWIR